MKLVWLFIFIFLNNSLFGHIYLNSCAGRVGVANLNIISSSPLTSYYQAGVSNSGLSTSISQPFQFSNLESGNLSYSQNFKNTSLSVGSLYLLSDYYNLYSNYFNLNYTLHNLVTLGVSQKFISVNEEVNYFKTITDVGCKISYNKTMIALNYTNILHQKSFMIELPNIISTEISYNPLSDTYLAVGLDKEKNHKLTTKLGIRYKTMKHLTLLSGYCLEPNQITFGIGLDYRRVNINYAIITHQELNSTHHISLMYEL